MSRPPRAPRLRTPPPRRSCARLACARPRRRLWSSPPIRIRQPSARRLPVRRRRARRAARRRTDRRSPRLHRGPPPAAAAAACSPQMASAQTRQVPRNVTRLGCRWPSSSCCSRTWPPSCSRPMRRRRPPPHSSRASGYSSNVLSCAHTCRHSMRARRLTQRSLWPMATRRLPRRRRRAVRSSHSFSRCRAPRAGSASRTTHRR
mmetsp:Transcript_1277/g.3348  ORF Transcript_1277/g.3348 Transcript_1277/m.3348 type:complete len:204 (-) Transcript_1277:340-951(-)